MTDKRAYLIDSSIYIYRGWHTVPVTRLDKDGQLVNALHGYADMLLMLLESEHPTHIACAFDKRMDNCWRREIDPRYKAHRPETPPNLRRQFLVCQKLVDLAGIANFVSDRYEADDIIGTLSRNLRKCSINCSIVTADKDLTQLVQDGDFWWEFSHNKRLDSKGIFILWGVYPEQIADLLALCGDRVDNIEGVPGIGNKTAVRVLTKYGNVEAVLSNIDTVGEMKFRGATRTKNLIYMYQDNVRLAKQLTIIKNDPSLPNDPSALLPSYYDEEQLKLFFEYNKLEHFSRWHHILQSLNLN